MNTSSFRNTALALICLSSMAHATDTTPPTLSIPQTWIEKSGGAFTFKLMLDPQDNVGVDRIEFRSALNTTGAVPANVSWDYYPWDRGVPLQDTFICSAVSIEVRAKDAAGNISAVQRRTFKAPFPVTAPPNLEPKFGGSLNFPV